MPEQILTDLKSRLKNTRSFTSIDGTFQYGFNSDTLKKIINHWSSKYDWRKFESKLNSYPQFTTQIEGIDIHYFHVKPSKPSKEVKPLLLVHGWPGSNCDFLSMIPDLTNNADLAFELVIPSIPGFAWSESSHKPGLNIIHVARIFAKLMKRLKYEHFVYHGQDWGSHIGKAIGVMYPDRVIGVHVTLPTAKVTLYTLLKVALGSIVPAAVYENSAVDYDKIHPLSERLSTLLRESGYFHIQATKPDSIAAGLSDSPAGLAAYVLDRVAVGTNVDNVYKVDGGLFEKFTLDQLCDLVTTTWVTNSIASSMRLYKESFSYHVQYELNFERSATLLFHLTFIFYCKVDLKANVSLSLSFICFFISSLTESHLISFLRKESLCLHKSSFAFQKLFSLKFITMLLSTLIYLEVVISSISKNQR